MTRLCNLHLHPSHQLLSLKKSLRHVDIPPRKLLIRRSAANHDASADIFSDDTLLLKYLPHNTLADSSDDDSDDPYSSDHFRMYDFKVRRCTRSRSHDWTDCPFAHPGEKARRRDPRRFHYTGTMCPEYRRDGTCRRGDACEFSHGVFECWLHPARYRTEACKDGKSCKRKVCFFAHTPRQLRVLPSNLMNAQNDTVSCKNHIKKSNNNHFCLLCHSCACSPTSNLFGISPSSPPPFHHHGGHGGVNVSYKEVPTEILSAFEGLNFGGETAGSNHLSPSTFKGQNSNNNNNTMPWIPDICCEDHQNIQNNNKQHFILSPTVSSSHSMSFSNNNGGKLLFSDGRNFKGVDDVSVSSWATPDLGWVNDLLT
ncbi:hypothetical protein PIB30_054341 [Stylosanthes scabra]|uniref:C3H1-type domain-containing protein n=1 Tax=Stylosanthes scabra TaxID=79078 RepID=A0ABU6WIK8_9FABA|nr:hypothetical protein [Stylosanthes scabra]